MKSLNLWAADEEVGGIEMTLNLIFGLSQEDHSILLVQSLMGPYVCPHQTTSRGSCAEVLCEAYIMEQGLIYIISIMARI